MLLSLFCILITIFLLFIIRRLFNNFKIEFNVPFKLNIKSEKVIVLSREGCPWCDKLEPELLAAKNSYTKIIMNDDGTFTFDETFTQLDKKERESIMKGSRHLMDNKGYYFPTIIYKNDYHLGLPDSKTLNAILNE